MSLPLATARALLEQHDREAERGTPGPTQLGLADLVRSALREVERLRDEHSQIDVEGTIVLCDVCERAILVDTRTWRPSDRPSGECFCGRPLGHGPQSDADEVLPAVLRGSPDQIADRMRMP